MSKTTKRKYVTQEVMDNLFIPEEPCYIVKVSHHHDQFHISCDNIVDNMYPLIFMM